MVAGRQRFAPKGLFVPRTDTLGKFGERVGRLLYDDSFAGLTSLMHSEARSDEHAVGDDEELVTLVREQVLGGLSRGIFTAGASWDANALHRRRLRAALVDEEDEDDVAKICAWTISKDFWSHRPSTKELSWAKSTACISSTLLISTEHPRKSAAELFLDAPPSINTNVCIIAPDEALRKVSFFEPLPSASRIAEYTKCISLSINAAIAAAWRLICIKKLDLHHGQIKDLVTEIDRFLIANGYKVDDENLASHPTHATLESIISGIRRQVKLFESDQSCDHAEVPVLFNSTPVQRARKLPQLF